MSSSDAAESLIAVASALKDAIRALCDEYLLRPAAIERERRILRDHDVGALFVLKDEYEAQNARVDVLVDALRQRCADLQQWQQKLLPTPPARAPQTVTEALDALANLRNNLKAPDIALKVLDHIIGAVNKAWAEFAEKKRVIEPLVDVNRHLLEALLRNYQDSYRFWQEECEKAVTSYGPSGKQRTTGRGSGFAVRA